MLMLIQEIMRFFMWEEKPLQNLRRDLSTWYFIADDSVSETLTHNDQMKNTSKSTEACWIMLLATYGQTKPINVLGRYNYW